jgi:hypothetical protein
MESLSCLCVCPPRPPNDWVQKSNLSCSLQWLGFNFVWLSFSCQQIYVTGHAIYNHQCALYIPMILQFLENPAVSVVKGKR